MKIRPAFFLVFVIVLLGSPLLPIFSAENKPSPVTVASRHENGQETVLLIIKATQAALDRGAEPHSVTGVTLDIQGVDEISVKLEKDDNKKSKALYLPDGWSTSAEDSELKLTGAPLDGRKDVYIRITVGRVIEKTQVRIFRDGKKIFDAKITVFRLPDVHLADTIEDYLMLPPRVCPGEEIEFEPLEPNLTPAGGEWLIADTPATEIAGPPVTDYPRYKVTIRADLKPGDTISVQYTDPWGVAILKVTVAKEVQVVALPEGTTPRIYDCTPRAFAGSFLCVCGFFPNQAWKGVRLDGKPVPIIVSTSIQVIYILLPGDLQAGPHVFTGDASFGFPSSDRAEVLVLVIRGEIDQDELWKGQSTTMRLFIIGTQEPMSFRLKNKTPGIISLTNGDNQIVTTSGGSKNFVEEGVKGIHRGNFRIDYTLSTDPCPCVEASETNTAKLRNDRGT